MKLSSFTINHKQSYGIVTESGIIDLGSRLSDKYPDLCALIANNALSEAGRFINNPPDYQLNQISFLPVIPNPTKIIGVGMNYQQKKDEFGVTDSAPVLFIRFPDSQTGHQCPILRPFQTEEFDYEGELAVIIGKKGRKIPQEQVFEYIAGYSCYMDGSVRDWQYTWITAGKNWAQTGGFGPWLVTKDEIPEPHALNIQTRLNGQTVQSDHTDNMIHTIPMLIEYISTFTELSPGDVIITGSPGGVGKKRNPPLFMKEGDIIEVEIESIGCLHNVVAQAPN